MTHNTHTTTRNMTCLAKRLARPELLTLTPYQSARRIGGQGDVWINANESPFNNISVEQLDLSLLNRYPACQPPALIAAYSQYSGANEQHIVTTRGADEAIELLIRAFCVPNEDAIACFEPTYGMYAISAQTCNVEVKRLNLTAEYGLPRDYVSQVGNAKLVFICNPNNPTGSVIAADDIEQVLQALPNTLVVVDEAYIEFCPHYSVAPLLPHYPNLVILRTLSKAFALAGARCGFMLANEAVVNIIMQVIAPYPVPLPVSAVAEQALSQQGIARMRQQVMHLTEQGQRLAQALTQLGANVITPHGNFVTASFDTPMLHAYITRLSQAGIVARRYQDPRLCQMIRFSFSSEADTSRLIDALSGPNTRDA